MDSYRRALILIAVTLLSGCAGTPGLDTLVAPAPEAKPFVVETRPREGQYPAIGATPAARADTVLSPAEATAFKEDLKRAACRIPGRCLAN